MVYECNMNKTDVVWIEDQKEKNGNTKLYH